MKFVAVAAAALLSAAALFAYAGPNVDDPNDTRGVLDLKKAEASTGKRPRFKVITFARWTVDRIRDRGYFLVYLDTFGDDRFDFYALARSNGQEMLGRLYRDRKQKRDSLISGLNAWRRNQRSVTIRVPLSKLRIPESRTFYRWYALSLFTGPACKKVCMDTTPDGDPVTQPLPGEETPTPAPTPTPTATGSPSPTPSPTETPVPAPIPTLF